MPPRPSGSKPGVSQLLIASAMDADLCRRLLESPEEIFQDFDLTEDEKDLLRRPNQRMLHLFGVALAQQRELSLSDVPSDVHSHAQTVAQAAPQPHAAVDARTLPGISLALTLVPCAQYENGQLSKFAYAVWVNPLAEGVDPAALPMLQGAALPGQPLTPLHAVIQVSAVQLPDQDGKPQVGLSASLRQSSNVTAPPPPEAAGRPGTPPFGSDLGSIDVQGAVAAVRNASSEYRYDRLIELMHALRGGDVR
jgi:hypothetical protein